MRYLFFFFIPAFFALACSPKISYLGDSYPPTVNIDVYYDANDIDREYTVIGIARNEGDELERDDLQSIRDQMLIKARNVGADAILFISIARNKDGRDWDTNKIVEAKFLRYKD